MAAWSTSSRQPPLSPGAKGRRTGLTCQSVGAGTPFPEKAVWTGLFSLTPRSWGLGGGAALAPDNLHQFQTHIKNPSTNALLHKHPHPPPPLDPSCTEVLTPPCHLRAVPNAALSILLAVEGSEVWGGGGSLGWDLGGHPKGSLQSWAPSTANTGLKTGKKDRVHLASSSPHFFRSLQSSSDGLEFSPRPGGDLPGSCSPVGTLTLFLSSPAPCCLSLWSSDGPCPPPSQASQVPPPTLASVHTPRPRACLKPRLNHPGSQGTPARKSPAGLWTNSLFSNQTSVLTPGQGRKEEGQPWACVGWAVGRGGREGGRLGLMR